MKNLFLVCLVTIFTLNASAQTLFSTKKGAVQVHAAKDDKGKISGYSQTTITEVEGSGANMTITYSTEALDKDKKSVGAAVPYKMVVKDNVIIFDLKSMFGAAGGKVEVTGDPIELPNKLSAGQVLKNANIVMTTKAGLMKTKTEMKISDYKCEAVESVTVPAGTFKSYKVTQTITTSVMNQKMAMKTVSWYADGVGMVKSQSYDDKGTLMSTTELIQK